MYGGMLKDEADLDDAVKLRLQWSILITRQGGKEDSLEMELTERQAQIIWQLLEILIQHTLNSARNRFLKIPKISGNLRKENDLPSKYLFDSCAETMLRENWLSKQQFQEHTTTTTTTFWEHSLHIRIYCLNG